MIILGLNAYHGDSSASLVIDGVVVNAIEEERIRIEQEAISDVTVEIS